MYGSCSEAGPLLNCDILPQTALAHNKNKINPNLVTGWLEGYALNSCFVIDRVHPMIKLPTVRPRKKLSIVSVLDIKFFDIRAEERKRLSGKKTVEMQHAALALVLLTQGQLVCQTDSSQYPYSVVFACAKSMLSYAYRFASKIQLA